MSEMKISRRTISQKNEANTFYDYKFSSLVLCFQYIIYYKFNVITLNQNYLILIQQKEK